MTDHTPSYLSHWLGKPLYRLLPDWLASILFCIPFARRLEFSKDVSELSFTKGKFSAPLSFLTDEKCLLKWKWDRTVDAVIPQSLLLERHIKAPHTASSSLFAIAKLDLQRQTPFQLSDVFWGLEEPKRINGELEATQWIAKTSDVSAWRKNAKERGLRLRRIYVQNAKTIEPLADFTAEIAPFSKHLRRFNGVLAAFAIACMAVTWLYPAWALKPELKELELQNAALKAEALDMRVRVENLRDYETERAAFLDVIKRRALLSDTLRELTTSLPDNVWIEALEFQTDKVAFKGETTASAPELVLTLARNRQFRDPKLTGSTSRTSKGAERFEMAVGLGGGS